MQERDWIDNPRSPEGEPSRWSVLYAPRNVWWGIFFLIWTVQVGLFAFVSYYRGVRGKSPIGVGDALLLAAFDWYLWGAVCLVCFWIARRLPLERHGPGRLLATLVLWAAGLTLARGLIDQALSPLMGWASVSLSDRLIHTLPGRLLMVLLFIGVGYAIEYVRQHRDRELRASRLRAELVTTQLQMLKVQLQPHFLFNTLHAISSLMYIDVKAADRMLVRLSELLRRTLQTMDAQQVTLAEEMSYLEPYLEIEKTRLAHRLHVEVRVAPETLTAMVPHLILQPLVENAIRHGIAPKVGGGTLVIESAVRGSDLVLTVTDDGMGLREKPSPDGSGVGLTNTRERLRHLYGEAFRLTLADRPMGGVQVTVEFPLERAELPTTQGVERPATAGSRSGPLASESRMEPTAEEIPPSVEPAPARSGVTRGAERGA